jgi:hypothetical protein
MTAHLIECARERYNIALVDADCRAMSAAITRGESILLAHLRDGAERRLVTHNGTVMIVVFKPSASVIITALPKNSRSGLPSQRGRSRRLRNH